MLSTPLGAECPFDDDRLPQELAENRCPDCLGFYGYVDPDDWWDYPCCCPWPAETIENAALGEQFIQEDGKPGYYSADGFYLLRSSPLRAAFNGPDGRPLYVYPNPEMRPPQQRVGTMMDAPAPGQVVVGPGGLRARIGNGAATAWGLSGLPHGGKG